MSTAILNTIQSASLYCTDGNADKVYHCQVVEVDGGHLVNYQYGRRGNMLQTGCKTQMPLAWKDAVKVFDKLVADKTKGGYRASIAANDTSGGMTVFDKGQQPVCQLPQLLNAVDEDQVPFLLNDHGRVLQEKKDGKRILIDLSSAGLIASNKRGMVCDIPAIVADQVKKIIRHQFMSTAPITDVLLDGEMVGEVFFVFDILRLNGESLKHKGLLARYSAYATLLGEQDSSIITHIIPLPLYGTSASKMQQFEKIKAENGEGVVFKEANAPYTEGRPNSGGTALKYKFTESATCICLGGTQSGKRSVRVGLLDAGVMVNVGNVTIPPNQAFPEPNDLLEIRYLYKYDGGSLYQPVFLSIRDDQVREDCALSQVTRIKAMKFDEEE